MLFNALRCWPEGAKVHQVMRQQQKTVTWYRIGKAGQESPTKKFAKFQSMRSFDRRRLSDTSITDRQAAFKFESLNTLPSTFDLSKRFPFADPDYSDVSR